MLQPQFTNTRYCTLAPLARDFYSRVGGGRWPECGVVELVVCWFLWHAVLVRGNKGPSGEPTHGGKISPKGGPGKQILTHTTKNERQPKTHG